MSDDIVFGPNCPTHGSYRAAMADECPLCRLERDCKVIEQIGVDWTIKKQKEDIAAKDARLSALEAELAEARRERDEAIRALSRAHDEHADVLRAVASPDRRIEATIGTTCATCKQQQNPEITGEYRCPACGMPTLHDPTHEETHAALKSAETALDAADAEVGRLREELSDLKMIARHACDTAGPLGGNVHAVAMRELEERVALSAPAPEKPAPATCADCGGRGWVGKCDCGAELDGLGGHDWECSAHGPAVGPAADMKPCPSCSGGAK